MHFLLVFLFMWFVQCSEPEKNLGSHESTVTVSHESTVTDSKRIEDFELYVSITDIQQKVRDQCNNITNCPYLFHGLCELAWPSIPAKLLVKGRESCTVTPLSEYENGTVLLKLTLNLVTNFSDGIAINLTCPTFGGLFSAVFLNLTDRLKEDRYTLHINGYTPKSIPFESKSLREVEYNGKGNIYLKITNKPPSYNEKSLLDRIKLGMDLLGQNLFLFSDVKTENETITSEEIIVPTAFTLKYPAAYIEQLNFNPFCDVVSLLNLSFGDKSDPRSIQLRDTVIKLKSVPIETMTTKPTTSAPSATSTVFVGGFASTVRSTVEILVVALVAIYNLVGI